MFDASCGGRKAEPIPILLTVAFVSFWRSDCGKKKKKRMKMTEEEVSPVVDLF